MWVVSLALFFSMTVGIEQGQDFSGDPVVNPVGVSSFPCMGNRFLPCSTAWAKEIGLYYHLL